MSPRLAVLAAAVIALAGANAHAAPRLETFAGTGAPGFSGDGGPAASAQLSNPFGIAHGPDGALFIGDSEAHRVRVLRP